MVIIIPVNEIGHPVMGMIDILEPSQKWSAGDFFSRATSLIPEIWNRGKIPLVVGGSTLYIRTLTRGFCQAPPAEPAVRERLYHLAGNYGVEYLYRKLTGIDPEITRIIHPSNLQRIIRALEVFLVSGVPFSVWQKRTEGLPWEKRMFGLFWDRKELYRRIDQRVERMIERGLVGETRKILDGKEGLTRFPALKGLGYRQAAGYLQGQYGYSEMVRLIKRDTRRYAKRQYTWWRKEGNVCWIKMDGKSIEDAARHILENLSQHGLLNPYFSTELKNMPARPSPFEM